MTKEKIKKKKKKIDRFNFFVIPCIINMVLLLTLENLVEGKVVKRPSAFIKTPYVADIALDEGSRSILGHTASLGCCGLADAGASVLMAKIEQKQDEGGLRCEYRVYLSLIHSELEKEQREIIVGIYPKLAEDLTEKALNLNLLSRLQNIQCYKRETVIYVPNTIDSRFDFAGIDENGTSFLLEVKTVPLAKPKEHDTTGETKTAYFPDGYRKKKGDVVSPRALKHINELAYIRQHSNTRCIMCYVIQRTDVDGFEISKEDPIYRDAFQNAMKVGVEIITMLVKWNRKGEAEFVCDNLQIL